MVKELSNPIKNHNLGTTLLLKLKLLKIDNHINKITINNEKNIYEN